MTETSIKAKSVKGYSTYNRKLTENKWKPGTAKPELVEDWDQRLLVTTLSRHQDGRMLELQQSAEKDQVELLSIQHSVMFRELCFRSFVWTASHFSKLIRKMRTFLMLPQLLMMSWLAEDSEDILIWDYREREGGDTVCADPRRRRDNHQLSRTLIFYYYYRSCK